MKRINEEFFEGSQREWERERGINTGISAAFCVKFANSENRSAKLEKKTMMFTVGASISNEFFHSEFSPLVCLLRLFFFEIVNVYVISVKLLKVSMPASACKMVFRYQIINTHGWLPPPRLFTVPEYWLWFIRWPSGIITTNLSV